MSSTAASADWYDLSWNDWIGVVGTILGLVGLWLTWRQARSAKDIALETKNAMEKTRDRLRANQLFLHVNQLRWLSSSLEEAVAADKRDAARVLLENWRHSAGQVHGTIKGDAAASAEMLTLLQTSIVQAATASGVILRSSKTMVASCSQARGAISDAYDSVNQWASQQAFMVPDQSGD